MKWKNYFGTWCEWNGTYKEYGNSVNCFNIKIYEAGELARLLIIEMGISVKEEFLSLVRSVLLLQTL